MGESARSRQRQRWSIERDELFVIFAVVGAAMLFVSGDSLSGGSVVGGAIGGAFGTMAGLDGDDGEGLATEGEAESSWWQPDVPAGLELVLVAGGLIAFVLVADSGWLLSMGEAGSLLLGPSLGPLCIIAWNRTVGSD